MKKETLDAGVYSRLFKKTLILSVCLVQTVFASATTNTVQSLFVEASNAAKATNLDRSIDTLLFLNHINYVVQTLDTYQNSLVLEQEYKTICANNLNINRIPNPEIKNALIDLLDAIYEMRRTEKDYMRAKEEIERNHADAKRDIWMKFACNALASGTSGAMAAKEGGPWVMGLGAGKAVLGEAVTAFAQFEQEKRKYQRQGRASIFAYEDGKEEAMHRQYKKLFNLQCRFGSDNSKESDNMLSGNFIIPDQYQLKGANVETLVNALKGDDADGVFRELKFLKDHKAYAFFPTFWYYYSIIAYKTEHIDDALEGCKHFNEINRGLFRSDPMAAAVAMTEASIMIERKQIDKVRLEQLLKIILKNDWEGPNSDWEYFCACMYGNVLDNPKEAYEILGAMISRLERQNSSKLVEHVDLFTEKENKIEAGKKKDDEKFAERENFFADHPVPIDSDLVRARILLRQIMSKNKDPMTAEYLREVCYKNTTSSLEKLYYVGLMKTDSLWKIAKEDVEKLTLRYHRLNKKSGMFIFELPMTWFILGDFKIVADLYQGTNKVCSLNESVKGRHMVKSLDRKEYDVAAIRIPCQPSLLNGKDSVVIRLPHKSWPVQVMYMPDINYDIDDYEKNDSCVTFIPNKAVFMNENEKRPLKYADMNAVKQKIANWPKEEGWNRIVYGFASEIRCNTGSVVSVSVTNRSYLISCTNTVPLHRSIDLKVLTFNHYGAKFCTIGGELDLKPYAGVNILLDWPAELKGCLKPAYLAIESKEYRSTMNEWDDFKLRDHIPFWKSKR